MGMSWRDGLAAPSMIGFLGSTFAAGVVPAAIPIATMAGTLISDPGQIFHAGNRHGEVANTTGQAKDDTDKIIDDKTGFQTTAARTEFDNRMKQYTKALGDTKDQHSNLNTIMNVLGGLWTAAGAASAAVGTTLALLATEVISTSWIPGVDAASFAGANGAAGGLNGVLRTVLQGLRAIIGKLKDLLGAFMKLSGSRKLLFGGLAVGGMYFKPQITKAATSIVPGHKTVTWPSDKQPSQDATTQSQGTSPQSTPTQPV
jgi:hypothetical protein